MGLFEFLTKKTAAQPTKQAAEPKRDESREQERVKAKHSEYAHIDEFRPHSFDDVAEIIDCLMSGKPALVRLNDARDTTAQRALDILSGAIYALYGNVAEVGEETYLFTLDDNRSERDKHGRIR